MNICVYGSVSNNIDKSYMEYVELLGKKIAEKNHTLIFGGMKTGILGAVARGASNNGSTKIIAIIPELFKEYRKEEIFENCTQAIYTKDLNERKEKFREMSDAIIITPGGIGTLDEFFDIVCSKRLGYYDKPIVIYNINNYYDNLIEMLENSIKEGFVKEDCRKTYKICNEAEEVLDYIERWKFDG